MKQLSLLLALFLLACSQGLDLKLDGSTPEAYQRSLAKIKEKATPEEVKQLNDALVTIAFSEMGTEGGLLGMMARMSATGGPEQISKDVMAQLSGKTGREVIALATEKRKTIARKQLESVTSEITKLDKAKIEYDAAKGSLAKITATQARYFWRDDSFMPQALIEFKLTNGMDKALSRVFFHGTLSTPGRTIPWVSDDFNYEIAGGLEPNESKLLTLRPNMFSGGWNNADLRSRKDLVLVIETVNAESGKGNMLAPAFGQPDQERLATLRDQQTDLKRQVAGN